jgi:uracil-DNA glycosylase family 4
MKPRASKVPPKGDPNNSIMALVGEQPGRTEVRRREPFCGPAGDELDKDLNSAGIPRSQCYITNTFKDLDFPLEYYVTFKRGSVVYSADGLEYLQILKEELLRCKANVIVAVGGVALHALCDRTGIMKWRGSIIESTLVPGKKVVPMIHPSTVIPPKNQFLNKRLIIFDLIRALEQSQFPEIRLTPRTVLIEPSYFDCIRYLEFLEEKGLSGTIIDFDIEVYKEEISCISFAYSPDHSISIPFIKADRDGTMIDYFTPDQEMKVWQGIAKLLENPLIIKRGQNLAFDCTILLAKMGIKVHNVRDIMVNQKIIMPDYKVGLDFTTSIHTDIPYYKDDGKKWFKIGGSWRTFWHYNGMDSIATAAIEPEQTKEIAQQKNKQTVERQTKIIEPLVYMSSRGVRVDIEGMKNYEIKMTERINVISNQLKSIVGDFKKLPSPQQLAHYFYTVLGHKPYLTKGHITTDDTALIRLARKGIKEASMVKELRTLRKVVSTYANIDKVSADGRLHCSYNPVGTKTGRISSSEDIFGKGMNLQNWPHPLLKFLIVDEGCVFYSLDLSQAENRIVAYVGKVPRMIQAFENEEDVHRLTAGLIFSKSPEEVSDEPGSAHIGGGNFSERFYGKKSNHSLNYDLGYKKFALVLEIPEADSKWLVERYHSVYPEVRGVYHQNIKMQLAKDRTITNLMERRRVFLDNWGDDMFKEAYAQIPQSSVADIIDERGLIEVYYNQDKYHESELLMQVHDSIVIQIPLSHGWKRHAEILLDIKKSLEQPLSNGETEFVIPADISMGLNLYKEEGKDIKHNKTPKSIDELAVILEKNYNELITKQEEDLNEYIEKTSDGLVGELPDIYGEQ